MSESAVHRVRPGPAWGDLHPCNLPESYLVAGQKRGEEVQIGCGLLIAQVFGVSPSPIAEEQIKVPATEPAPH